MLVHYSETLQKICSPLWMQDTKSYIFFVDFTTASWCSRAGAEENEMKLNQDESHHSERKT